MSKSHEGEYYCKAFNDIGSDMKKIKLTVEGWKDLFLNIKFEIF